MTLNGKAANWAQVVFALCLIAAAIKGYGALQQQVTDQSVRILQLERTCVRVP